jgi:transcriptional regulator with XRE-family HTH domain
LIGTIQHALHQALAEEQGRTGLTQSGMAGILDVSKSFVSRKMNGTSNMTLETLADLAFALDRVVKVELLSRVAPLGSNHAVDTASYELSYDSSVAALAAYAHSTQTVVSGLVSAQSLKIAERSNV